MTARSVSITVPISDMDQANADLEAEGLGPGNLSVALRNPDATVAKEAACHWWATPDQVTRIRELLPSAVVSERELDDPDGIGAPHFQKLVDDRGLDWSNPRKWATTMAGDRKKDDAGTEFESRRDYNSWPAGSKAHDAWAKV